MHGIEIELAVLLILQALGTTIFSKFETETPLIKRLLKWILLTGGAVSLYLLSGTGHCHFRYLYWRSEQRSSTATVATMGFIL